MVDRAPIRVPRAPSVYRVADIAVRINAHEGILDALAAIFRRLPCVHDPRERADIELDVRRTTGAYRLSGAGITARHVADDAPFGQIALELVDAVAEAVRRRSAFRGFRAAVLERDGIGLALDGPSQAANTTLAAHLLSRDWRLLCDAYAFVDAEAGRVVAFPKLMAVAARSLPFVPRSFRRCCETSPWFAEPDGDDVRFYAVDPAHAYGEDAWATSARLRRFVDLRQIRDAPCVLEECDLASPASAMRGVRTATLRYDDPIRASDALEDWLV